MAKEEQPIANVGDTIQCFLLKKEYRSDTEKPMTCTVLKRSNTRVDGHWGWMYFVESNSCGGKFYIEQKDIVKVITENMAKEEEKKVSARQNKVVFPDGQVVFIPRPTGVSLFVDSIDNDGDFCVLTNLRGQRTNDNKGKWNVPAGFLEWDESGERAAQRECEEECGISVPIEEIKQVETSTDPKENRQHVIFRYYAVVGSEYMNKKLTDKDSEEDEVRDIKWIKLRELDNYEFAWNMRESIVRIFATAVKDNLSRFLEILKLV